MKKLFTLAISGICALAFAAALDAATVTKVQAPTKGETFNVYSKNVINGGSDSQVYANHITGSGAESGFSLYYLYSNNIIHSTDLFNKLKDALNDPFSGLVPSVSNEIFTTGLEVFSNNQSKYENMNVDWTNVAAAATTVVPGRTAGLSTSDDSNSAINAEDISAVHEGEDVLDKEEYYKEEVTTTQLGKGENRIETTINIGTKTRLAMVDGVLTEVYDVYQTQHVTQIYAQSANKYVSPLVLDMTGNGVLQASNGQHMPGHPLVNSNMVLADFYGDGFEIAMEWVGPQDGLLVAPKADGTVDMSCLFGTAGGYESGYEKLSLHDLNNDGKVSGEELNGLSVWQDANGNGIAEAGEVQTVAELGITSIALSNSADFISSFERNGKTYKMWDWWPNAVELIKISAL